MNYQSFTLWLQRLSDKTNGYIFFWFLILVFSLFIVFMSPIAKIGAGINLCAIVGLMIYRHYNTEEKYNSFQTTLVFILCLMVGNTLFFYPMFNSLSIAFASSFGIFSPILINQYHLKFKN